MAMDSYAVGYWLRRRLGITEVRREKFLLVARRFQDVFVAVVRHRMGGIGVGILAFFVTLAIIAPLLPLPHWDQGGFGRIQQPSWEHPFGTDQLERDILSRVVWGTRISLLVGFVSAAIAGVLGTLIGLASGYWGGWRDETLMRVNDILLSLPWLVLLIVVATILKELSLEVIVLSIGLTSWSFTARVVRAQVLSIKERVFVERAKAAGASSASIIRRHIFPNVFPLVFANTILTVAVAILSESALAYLGKVNKNNLSWGVILQEADASSAVLNGYWVWIVMPGLALVFVILGFSLLGYALDEILNPKLRER
ncbi:MAG TPA: ABC transporter permease [Thermoplasmata archaeon]|nr:ABC transporter permease [Thermoplasmata archaeon]